MWTLLSVGRAEDLGVLASVVVAAVAETSLLETFYLFSLEYVERLGLEVEMGYRSEKEKLM